MKARDIYHGIKDSANEIFLGQHIGLLYGRNAKFSKAEQQFLIVLKQSQAIKKFNPDHIYFHLAGVNRYMGNYNKALGYALQSVKAMEAAKNFRAGGFYYGELAEIYEALDMTAESVVWYKKCIDAREVQPGYPAFALYRTYSLLILQLIKSGAQKEALAVIKSLQKRRPPNTLGENAVLFQGMAYCYDAMNVYDSTEKYFLKAVTTFDKANKQSIMDDEIIQLAHYDIANFYVRHHLFENARPHLDVILSNPKPFNVTKMAEAQLLQFKVDSASAKYEAAIKHFQEYKILTDSIFNDKKSRQIEELQIEYETEKKDQEIGLLTKKDQLQQANLKQANIIKNWITASAILLVLLLTVGYSRYRFKQKANRQLEEQQLVINQKNISLLHLVNEKEWLIKEIHHRVKNNFHIVMGLLGTQSSYLKNDEALTAVKASQQRIHAMSIIHQKLYQSENMSAIDMPGYIHELVDYLKESLDKGDAIRYHLQVDRISLALSHVVPAGLILNEAITNVFKYAFPNGNDGNIYISFTRNAIDNSITLIVKDDGIGLPAGFDSGGRSSMGLNLMKGLSEDIDGRFSIESANGTVVTVCFIYEPDISKYFSAPVAGENLNA